ncbi:hypothetical protein E2C01_037357 [Portunus trituberculatus]|uniref:Uncharacterized protein n=1 Tax=Portunus trituberculatus TaxID=210409 RepID=A0A5B7FDY1_PORTR|nr:hypothetical protein [Portunus trituberculatus]
MWSLEIEVVLELVREKDTSGTPEINYTVKKKSLHKSFDEIAATPQELCPSMEGGVDEHDSGCGHTSKMTI